MKQSFPKKEKEKKIARNEKKDLKKQKHDKINIVLN